MDFIRFNFHIWTPIFITENEILSDISYLGIFRNMKN